MRKNILNFLASALLLSLASCSKGYKVRFANYYSETMDSVVIGNNLVVIKNIEVLQTSDFYNVKKGKHSVKCISKSKKHFYSELTIPSTGTGKRTVQIDGVKQISVLEE